MSAFEDLGVLPEIIKAIEELDWLLPTPIQSEAIPLILGGGDILAAAETGSGKTGAFALPILQITYETLNNKADIPVLPEDQSSNESKDNGIEWDQLNRDRELAVDGLVCQARSAAWNGIRATKGISSGKFYYEAIIRDEGLCRVGWALSKATRNIGTDKFSWGYGGTGKKSHQGTFADYGKPFGNNDCIGCYINFDDEVMGYTKNGEDFGEAFTFNSKAGIFYPALVLKNAEIAFNFGKDPMKHQLKGYKPLIEAELLADQASAPAPEPSNNKNIKKSNKKEKEDKSTNTQSDKPRKPLSLIIEPTRELADQTYSAILNFSKYLDNPNIQVSLCIGGEKSLGGRNKIEGDIIIGTPGRLESLVKDGSIDLSSIRFFVLDEADQLIEDNLSIVNYIYNKLPIGQNLQILFFSATLHSNKVIKFSEQITKNPTWVDLKGKDFIPDLITHAYIKADPSKYETLWRDSENPLRIRTDGVHAMDVTKFGKLKEPEQKSEAIKLLKAQLLLKCIQSFKMDQAIIFARTRVDCDCIHNFLKEAGGESTKSGLEGEYSSTVLHGDVNKARKENLEKFKNGEVRFLICTDVAARGIDIRGLPFMINYTLPASFEDYIHRVGRVGRADRIGLAISLVGSDQEKVWYHTCRDKGRGCHNTKLTENGGCCIWYDEPELFHPIQESIGPVELNDQFQLPQDMNLTFGASSNKSLVLDYQPHTEELSSRVEQLSQLEQTIQRDYLSLPIRITEIVNNNNNKMKS
ncbi:hypothetical protein DICPUDRAFT_154178 [Dictyostelium purpureum]|uniref:ATP-dependent RNA helicase n=1 Tax=Dictyostelium purpureum TaxID=5786 RepID=F0ZQN9_DICPU|nr:uncharacterized protein DICPUDRAFT_154178 [Dictyostelium purpureum]EGC33733.1 hypothetical protein DICPUDRAFT_154178 [Dictyostelium purpureum]|eukprot:XP_003289732.1 hypothetical protein DICPUDRAFT_154178 [Dictyostelium purpureum]